MTPDGSHLLDLNGDGKIIIDGHFHHPLVEGPKLFKRNGYYYIFAPAGGVKGGWEAVFRSKSIYGPYEDRIVLCQGNTDINGPHQGGWVETLEGQCWFLHFQDRGPYGRVVHLQPMIWQDDWPMIGREPKAPNVFEPVTSFKKPNVGKDYPVTRPQSSDDFSGSELGLQWQWMANPNPAWYSLTDSPGRLRLFSQGTPSGKCNWWEAGNLLLQKPQDMYFRVTTELHMESAAIGDRSGLILTGSVSSSVVIEESEQGWQLKLMVMEDLKQYEPKTIETLPWNSNRVFLRLEMADGVCKFSVSKDGKLFSSIGDVVRPQNAGWIGAKIGLLCLNPGTGPSGGFADFDDFIYEAL
jgi:beta-xylosidase